MALIGTLTTGVSALRTFSKSLEVIGNNIANINTTAYKTSQASFADTFSNTLRSSSSAPGDSSVQVGTGVQLVGINTTYTQGALTPTGNVTDVGIAGAGYFIVQDALGKQYATRDGAFTWSNDGTNVTLVNGQGHKVVGDATGFIEFDPVDFQNFKTVSISSDGTVTGFQADGTAVVAGERIGLQIFTDLSKLTKQGGNLYDFSIAGALSPAGTLFTAGSGGAGMLQSGTLEQSNVDITQQFSDLITIQRSFQAGSRLITISDSVLEDIVNLKRN